MLTAGEPTSSLRKFWAQLRGPVHPEDALTFRQYPKHSFDLRFPPPAFIGDPDRAPIVILMSNGGYKPGITEAEFPDQESVAEYRLYLAGEVATLPSKLARYYATGRVGEWIYTGKAVLVNAVPYRSVSLSKEKYNQELAGNLASLAAHRRWLFKEVLPESARSRRFVLIHRNGWWNVPSRFAGPCVLFSDPARAEPNRQAPDTDKLDQADRWLLSRRA